MIIIEKFSFSFFFFLFRKGKPEVDPNIALPAFYGGLMFGTAMCFFMMANEKLSPVSY